MRELEAQLKSVMADNQRMCHEKSDILEQHDLAMYNSERWIETERSLIEEEKNEQINALSQLTESQ